MSIVLPMAFPGPGNGDALMRGEAPADYLLDAYNAILNDDYFGAVEITNVNDPSIRKSSADLLRSSGKTVLFGCYGPQLAAAAGENPGLICSLDDAARRSSLDQLRSLLDQAVEVGATYFSFLSGKDLALLEGLEGDSADKKRLLQQGLLVESLTAICNEASGMGVTVLLEPFDRRLSPPGSKAFKGMVIGPAETCVRLGREMSEAGIENFGLLPDTSHMVLMDEWGEDLAALTPYIRWFHAANCVNSTTTPDRERRFGDLHPAFGVDGSEVGAKELGGFLRRLHSAGYSGPVGYEVRPIDEEDPREIIASSKAVYSEAQNET